MASLKNNIRSFRYSDEVASILENQPGDSLNAKFENLVLRCFRELPKREEELKRIQQQIADERQKLYDTKRAGEQINNIMSSLQAAKSYVGIVERAAKQIADAALEEAV